MHLHLLLALTSFLLPYASANCTQFGYGPSACKWYGTAPVCHGTKEQLRHVDTCHVKDHGLGCEEMKDLPKDVDPKETSKGLTLVAWTKEVTIGDLYYKQHKVSEDCYWDYGMPCWGGYKRLWCDEDKPHN